MTAPGLRLVAFEVTRTCPLACKHCRGDSASEAYTDEVRLDEIQTIFDNITAFAHPIMIITGGEPLTRPDIFDITAASTAAGFRTVLATCGALLDLPTAKRLVSTGVQRISVSLDGATASSHDSFRGVPGAFDSALRGIRAAREAGLPFQVNSTLTTLNINELDALYDLAISLGAEAFHPFLLVPMGRGALIANTALSPTDYEAALVKIAKLAASSPFEIKPTCSPHYSRITRQMRKGAATKAPKGHGAMTRGCLGGQGFVFISHRGTVQMCGFLEIEAGNLRTSDYDIAGIWESSPLFTEVRNAPSYTGKCGICEYFSVCGGCRARAYAVGGDHLGDEPSCLYEPKRSQS